MRKTLALAIAGLMAACASIGTNSMEIPKVKPSEEISINASELSSIAYEKTVTTFKRGTVIGRYPRFNTMKADVLFCNKNYPNNAAIYWDDGPKSEVDWMGENGQSFYEAMKKRGFNVLGNPLAPFAENTTRGEADYSVAAVIKEMRSNFCEDNALLLGVSDHKPNTFAGEVYLDIDWVIYDRLARKEAAVIRASGYAFEPKPKPKRLSMPLIFNQAFAAAAVELSNRPEFIQAIRKRNFSERGISEEAAGELLEIKTARLSNLPIKDRIGELTRGTVVLTKGDGHGSGFVISKEGHIITAAHVAGNAGGEITVKFSNGIEIPGKVLRSNKYRDSALVKVAVGGLTVIPLELSGAIKTGDEVHAVGAPMHIGLASTVSRGIVSAFRAPNSTEPRRIQSDVMVAGGNSGGPLVDAWGNVVGICVSGIPPPGSQLSAGLNFFAPIDEVLSYLNIKATAEP